MRDGNLISPATQAARLQIPVEFPDQYTLRIVLRRLKGNDSFNVGLPLGADRHVLAVVDGYTGSLSSLSLVDGRSGDNNPTTYRGTLLTGHQSHELLCRVRDDSIQVSCDGEEFLDWTGDRERLSLETRFWGGVGPRRLMVGCWQSSFEIGELEVTPIDPGTASSSGSPQLAATPPRPAQQPQIPTTHASPSAETTESARLPPGWIRYQGDGFEAMLPGKPNERKDDLSVQLVVETEHGSYALQSTDYAQAPSSVVELLDDFQTEFTADNKPVSSEEETLPWADAARRFVVLEPNGNVQIYRTIVAGKRLYVMVVVTSFTRIHAIDTQRFLDSFTLMTPPTDG